jgi:hypothetical protein
VRAVGRLEGGHERDPLQEQAAESFAKQLAADRAPSICTIRVQLHVGKPRAQQVGVYLAVLAVE